MFKFEIDTIQIAHGKLSIPGQTLPHDICIELDDLQNQTTKCRAILKRNSILPQKRSFEVTASTTIIQGSNDEIQIGILEGPEEALPAANQLIGYLVITGKQLHRDLIKGTSIDITVDMSESRDLTLVAYVTITDQEFKQTFKSKQRNVRVEKLSDDINELEHKLESEIEEAVNREDYEVAVDK